VRKIKTCKKESKGEQVERFSWVGDIYIYRIGTRAGPSFLKGPDIDNSVSVLILFNNLLYNLYSFAWELVYLEKSSLSKIVYIKWKMIFPYV